MNEPKTDIVATGAAHFDRMIEKLAQQKVDFTQIERMYELRDRYLKEEARKAWVTAMAAFKSEPIVIEKRRKVDYKTRAGARIKYDYAELADYTEVLGPKMSPHGLFFRWDSVQKEGQVYVTCIVTHVDGHSETKMLYGPLDDSGQKNPIQQLGSTESFLQRYTLAGITGVAARGMDDDGRGGEPVEEVDPQQELIDDLYAKIGLSESVTELQKLKPDIETLKNPALRRNVIGSYNSRLNELRGPPQVAGETT